MYKSPLVGQRLRVVTKWKTHFYFAKEEYDYHEYIGTVVPSNKWDAPGTFKLHTGRPEHPDSIIPINRVHSLEALDGSDILTGPDSAGSTARWEVPGSKGNVYVVTKETDRFSCSCPGFQFRKSCKHLSMVDQHQ